MNNRLISFALLLMIVTIGLTGCAPGEVTRLEISPSIIWLEPGQSKVLSVVGLDSLGNEITDIEDISWSVAGNIGVLSNNEVLKPTLTAGVTLGTGKVIVTSGEMSAEVRVEVVDKIPDPLVWADSFETGTTGAFPAGWLVNEQQYHTSNNTGFRVAKDVKPIAAGSSLAKYTNLKRADGVPASTMEISIPVIAKGRLEFSIYQPQNEASNFGIKPYNGDTRLVDFWMSASGALRLPGKDGEPTEVGTWLSFAWEWDVNKGVMHVYQMVGNKWVQKSPTSGYSINVAPNRIYIDGNTVEGRNSWGAIDNFKLYDLSIVIN